MGAGALVTTRFGHAVQRHRPLVGQSRRHAVICKDQNTATVKGLKEWAAIVKALGAGQQTVSSI